MPHLQFPVVWFGWFVEGDRSCISEAAWVVTLLYACVEQLLELVCHILVEEPEDAVCDPIRSWCFVLCQFGDRFLQLCWGDLWAVLQGFRVIVTLYIFQVCWSRLQEEDVPQGGRLVSAVGLCNPCEGVTEGWELGWWGGGCGSGTPIWLATRVPLVSRWPL